MPLYTYTKLGKFFYCWTIISTEMSCSIPITLNIKSVNTSSFTWHLPTVKFNIGSDYSSPYAADFQLLSWMLPSAYDMQKTFPDVHVKICGY